MKLKGLKKIRKIYGFTMKELSQRLRVSVTAVNAWENEDVDISEDRLEELSVFFGLNKELLLKEDHDIKDMMLIEMARAVFKIDEYKMLIKEDEESINSIVNESFEEVKEEIYELIWRTKEGEMHYEYMKKLMYKLVQAYSSIPFEEYDEFDSFFASLLDEIKIDIDKWKKLKLLYECLYESEYMADWENDYSLFCKVEDLLEKQIRDNVAQLYKKKLYDEGLYKPDWEVED